MQIVYWIHVLVLPTYVHGFYCELLKQWESVSWLWRELDRAENRILYKFLEFTLYLCMNNLKFKRTRLPFVASMMKCFRTLCASFVAFVFIFISCSLSLRFIMPISFRSSPNWLKSISMCMCINLNEVWFVNTEPLWRLQWGWTQWRRLWPWKRSSERKLKIICSIWYEKKRVANNSI